MHSPQTLWLTIIGMGLVTYGLRLSFIILLGKVTMPPLVERGLRFVPAATLSALIWPALLLHDGQVDVSLGNERLLAALVAGLVIWRTRNVLLTIGVGMLTLWLLQAIS